MNTALLIRAIAGYLSGVLLSGLLIFLPAGSLSYTNGWLCMGALFVPMLIAGVVMLRKAPELLKKRLEAREEQREQGTVVKLSGAMFAAGFAAAGWGFRRGWYILPMWVSIAAAAVLIAAYMLYFEVLRENEFLSRTIRIQQGQRVIDTGLYGIVRHPMYAATLIMFFAVPAVLGSVLSLALFMAYPFILTRRIMAEEALLEKELPGYADYMQRVRYRLIPLIW